MGRPGRTLRLSLSGAGADRPAAAALTGCQGRRCVWTHDFAPAFDTARSDIDRCVVVGVPNEATSATFEYRLGAAVVFVDPAAGRAGLRGVGGVDFDKRHSRLFGLVDQKRAELGERPRVQRGPLGLAKPYPVTDPRQLFDSDTASGAFSLGRDAFGNLVIQVGGKTGLFAASLPQQSPRPQSVPGVPSGPSSHLHGNHGHRHLLPRVDRCVAQSARFGMERWER
jgi:hypothetical protein